MSHSHVNSDHDSDATARSRERGNVPVGRFHAWWRGDALPEVASLPGLTIATTADTGLLAEITGIDAFEIGRRLERGNSAWIARLDGEPVAWGWCAARDLAIGELGIARELPPGERYLWDFFTVPAWRGRGIYPRLLQTIVGNDPEGERYWVGHDFANAASARGIAKAGFREVGPVYRLPSGVFSLVPKCPAQVAESGAALFGLSIDYPLSADESAIAAGR